MYRTIAITISVLAIVSAIYTFVTKSDLSTSITLCLSALVFFLLGALEIRSIIHLHVHADPRRGHPTRILIV